MFEYKDSYSYAVAIALALIARWVVVMAVQIGLGLLAAAFALWPLLHRRFGMTPPVTLGIVCVGGLVVALIWQLISYGVSWRAKEAKKNTIAMAQSVSSAKIGMKEPLKPPTLFSLFMSDLKPASGIRWDSFSDFTFPEFKPPIRIFYTIFSDLNANAYFASFYIPAISTPLKPSERYSYLIAEKLAADYARLLNDVRKKHWAEAQALGDASAVSTRDFSFSGRVYIYHADNFSVPERAALIAEFKKNGANVQFRSMDYAMAAWDSIQLGRTIAPPEYEIRNGFPALANGTTVAH